MDDLLKAAETGDLEAAKALLAQDPYRVSKKAPGKVSPLHRAAALGHAAIVALLLAHGAAPDAKDYGGRTALHAAAERGHLAAAQALAAHGAKLDLMDETGETALHKAARAGHADLAELLLAKGADPNLKGDCGGAPLHEAARAGQLETAERLLAHGALANAQSTAHPKRWSPWHEAQKAGHAALAELLASHGGADPAAGPISIHRAAEKGHLGRLALLLGQDPGLLNSLDFLHRRTPLHWAAANAQGPAAELLLARGADPTARDKQGRTPLDLAPEGLLAEMLKDSGLHR